MSRAIEFMMLAEAMAPRVDGMREAFEAAIMPPLFDMQLAHATGREVCARRARKLRKRGDIVRFKCWTAKGKCRYVWAPRFNVVKVTQ